MERCSIHTVSQDIGAVIHFPDLLTTGDPFFPRPVVCGAAATAGARDVFFLPLFSSLFCPLSGALRRCPPFQKCIQRQTLTNPKFTALRNPPPVRMLFSPFSLEVMHCIISNVKPPPSSVCTNVIFQIEACNSQKITVAQFQV